MNAVGQLSCSPPKQEQLDLPGVFGLQLPSTTTGIECDGNCRPKHLETTIAFSCCREMWLLIDVKFPRLYQCLVSLGSVFSLTEH